MTTHVIAIDGPAGSGKSSVSRQVAKRLQWIMLDTGAMYRAITWAILDQQISLEDSESIGRAATNSEITIHTDPDNSQVFVGVHDVTQEIRSPEVTAAVSAVSALAPVRSRLVDLQRSTVSHAEHGVVIEGRDIGTVVLPDARLKVFLTADPRVRAQRRGGEMGQDLSSRALDHMEATIRERDAKDSGREISPLKAASDAIEIDTSDLTQEQVVERIVQLAREVYPEIPISSP
ncbi:MAG: (d)CMP kinase [Candidatus Nanopelagicales bacterium]